MKLSEVSGADTQAPPPGLKLSDVQPAAPKKLSDIAEAKPAESGGGILKGAEELISGTLKRFGMIPGEIKSEFQEGMQLSKQGDDALTGKDSTLGQRAKGALMSTLGRLQEVGAPLGGPLHVIVGDPVEKATGSRFAGQLAEDAAGVFAPHVGGRIATSSRALRKGAEDAAKLGEAPKPEAGIPTPEPAAAPPPAAPAIHTEGPLSRPPSVEPREMENQLFQLKGMNEADKVEGLKRTEALPSVPPETWEKLYHHEENPTGEPLTPEESQIYDQHIKPMRDEANALTAELEHITGTKSELTEGPHTPRYPKGRTKSFGEVLEQWKDGVETRFGGPGSRSMRKTVDAQKRRQFFNAIDDQGEKQVVYVAPGGKVLPFGESTAKHGFDLNEIGTIKGKIAPGSKFMDGSGKSWSIEDATTKEIEGVAKTRYTKNVYANRLDNLLKLRSAVRNAKYLETLKSSDEWLQVAQKRDGNAVVPVSGARPWRSPKLDQFRDWIVDPKLADALDDFKRETATDPDSLNSSLAKIGRVVNAFMFINPKAHIDNVLNHMMVERGLVGNLVGAPSTVRNLVRATKSVLGADKDYLRTLRAGASLPYARVLSGDLHQTLIRKLGGEVERDPGTWNRLAQIAGYPDAKYMMNRFAMVPQKVLWAASDIMTLSRTYQLAEKGVSLEKAFSDTERHMPNYRVPGQVMGRRMLSEMFQNPAVGQFGRYQYGRLAGYFRLLKDAFGKDHTLPERAQAFDKMAMLFLYMTVLYPAFDYAWQQVTGNPNAKTTRAGAASIPQAALDVVNGDKNIGDLPQSLFTPGAGVETMQELYSGRYLWSGQPIVNQADIDAGRFGRAGKDAAQYGLGKLSTFGQMGDVLMGKGDMGQIGLGALGVKSPTDEQVAGRARGKAAAAKKAQRRDRKLESQGQ